jgi:hypothetical protein
VFLLRGSMAYGSPNDTVMRGLIGENWKDLTGCDQGVRSVYNPGERVKIVKNWFLNTYFLKKCAILVFPGARCRRVVACVAPLSALLGAARP